MHPTKHLIAAVTVAVALSMSACGGSDDAKPVKEPKAAPTSKVGTYKKVVEFAVNPKDKTTFKSEPFSLSGKPVKVDYVSKTKDGVSTKNVNVAFVLIHDKSKRIVDRFTGAGTLSGGMTRDPSKISAADTLKGVYHVEVQSVGASSKFTVSEFE